MNSQKPSLLARLKAWILRHKWTALPYKALRYLYRCGPKNFLLKVKSTLQNRKNRRNLVEENAAGETVRYEVNQDFSGMTTDIRTLALYLPQFHAIPENDEWWGKGFTEWTNVKKGRARFAGHYQPRVPEDSFGYYDLSQVETLRKQAALAKQHGVYGFAFYYYWFSGHRLLEKPMDLLIANPDIDLPFMAVWANENWTRTWDGLESSVLIKQEYTPEDARRFILDMQKYLQDPRYIRVEGKPVIGLYAPAAIPDVKGVLKTWRDTARECGVGEILIWTCSADLNAKVMGIEDAVDGEYEFPPRGKGFVPNCPLPDEGTAYDYKALVESAREFDIAGRSIPVYRGSMLQWDNAARKAKNYHCWLNFTPRRFYLWNRLNVKFLRENYPEEHRFLFVNAWNEWGEGTYLEPDKKYGYAAINALSRAIFDLPYDCDVPEEENILHLGAGLNPAADPDWDKALREDCAIAVQAHVFYPEFVEEIAGKLSALPWKYDLYISTDTQEKAEEIRNTLKKHSSARVSQVSVYPNKGRDVVPFLKQLGPVAEKYKYFCHIHTKKSLHTDLGDVWREYLYQNLMGNETILREIFHQFETRPDVGVIFPDNMDVVRHCVEWGSNRDIAEKHLSRMGLTAQLPDDPMFTAGNMFWARVDAVKNLLSFPYAEDDFPAEGAQIDGTLMHAIERLWLYVAKANGYTYQITRTLCDNRPLERG